MPGLILILALLAGLLGLENLFFGQFMLSRPIIFLPAAVITASLLEPALGMQQMVIALAGAIFLELFFLFSLPIGSTYVPDSIIGGSVFLSNVLFLARSRTAITAGNWAAIFVLLFLISLLFSYLGIYFDMVMRKTNSFIVEYAGSKLRAGDIKKFSGISFWGYVFLFFKQFLQMIVYAPASVMLIIFFLKIADLPRVNTFCVLLVIGALSRFALDIMLRLGKARTPILQVSFITVITGLAAFGKLWALLSALLVFVYYYQDRKSKYAS